MPGVREHRAPQRGVDARPAVDGQRLWQSLMAMAEIGATPDGGVERIALTDADTAGRELLLRWAGELGLESRTDEVGNLFVRLPGRDDDAAPVIVGSHLDTQPDGGRFDGALGVLAGFEALRVLASRGEPPLRPVELAVWTDEEGARFDVSCIGSSVYAGTLALADALALCDRDGITFGEALHEQRQAGQAGTRHRPAAYFELHIEQGPVLEELGATIGIVTGIPAIRWIAVRLAGRAAHAGTTPMERRADAVLEGGRLVLAVEQLAWRHGPQARATVCALTVTPNAGSVIAGGAELLVDLRHPEQDALEAMHRELVAAAEALAVPATSAVVWDAPATAFAPRLQDAIARAAERRGLPAHRVLSGAGHDAGYLAAVTDAAMIFVPCRDGVSHHPEEWCEPEHAAAGAQVLLDLVVDEADRPRQPTWR